MAMPVLDNTPLINAHTGLRGIAAMTVFVAHMELTRYFPNSSVVKVVFPVFLWQSECVDLFFMLSGFVLNWVYFKDGCINWKNYGIARIARICPLYFATLFFLLALDSYSAVFHHVPSPDLRSAKVLCNFFMISGFSTNVETSCINTPAWSISVEMILYTAIFPPLYFLNKKVGKNLKMLLMLGILSTIGLVLCYTGPQGIRIPLFLSGPARGVFGFMTGFFTCSIWRIMNIKSGTFNVMSLLASACAIFAILEVIPKWLLAAIFPFLVFATVNSKGWVSQFLTLRFFDYLGERSYSIYLWHWPVIIFFLRLLLNGHMEPNGCYPTQLACKAVLLMFFLTMLLAELSFRYFECPARKWLRQKMTALLGAEP